MMMRKNEVLHDDEFCCAGVFLQQLVQSDLTVGLKVKHIISHELNPVRQLEHSSVNGQN